MPFYSTHDGHTGHVWAWFGLTSLMGSFRSIDLHEALKEVGPPPSLGKTPAEVPF